MNTSKYSGAGAFVVVPVKSGAIVTQEDQKRLGCLCTWRHAKFSVIHFLKVGRAATLMRIMRARLSKRMRVYEITDRQWELRGNKPPTIPGTDIFATAKQLAAAFEV